MTFLRATVISDIEARIKRLECEVKALDAAKRTAETIPLLEEMQRLYRRHAELEGSK